MNWFFNSVIKLWHHTAWQIKLSILLIMLVIVSGCGEKDNKKPQSAEIMRIEASKTARSLYYTSNIKPILYDRVMSPADGTIREVNFNYGQPIKNGDNLFRIDSTSLRKEYRDSVASFLKAKDDANKATESWVGTEEMYKEGLISKNEFIQAKSSYQDTQLSLIQTKNNLLETLSDAGVDDQTIENLDLHDIQSVEKVLNAHLKKLDIAAPRDGIVLIPDKDANGSSHESSHKIEVGSQVKKGQLLVSIGDLSGISLDLEVSEIDIHQITPGLPALITGNAFPGLQLHGKISNIDSQADPSKNSGLPTFPITVIVPNLSADERKQIEVGMSADISITIDSPKKIMIPIKAVIEKSSSNFVKFIDPTTNETKLIPITTGNTSESSVEVIDGLKEGDHIVVTD